MNVWAQRVFIDGAASADWIKAGRLDWPVSEITTREGLDRMLSKAGWTLGEFRRQTIYTAHRDHWDAILASSG